METKGYLTHGMVPRHSEVAFGLGCTRAFVDERKVRRGRGRKMGTGEQMRRVRVGAAIALITIAVAASLASGENNKATKANSSGGASAATQTFKVGDEVKLGDWRVKVWGVQDPLPPPSEFEQPAAGNRYVAVDTEVFNDSKTPQSVSSIACFELQDAANKSYNMTIVTGAPNPPDGEIAPGQSRRGTLVYEVPTTSTGLKLVFKCDLFSTGSAVISLS
jgi:hypothetical protein